jgi:dihydroflavonol-4-reductase
MTDSKQIFVTGATGFIGRHLVRHLLGRGHRIVALVRDPDVHPADLGGAHVSEIRTVVSDVADPARYRDALAGCDAAIHLAAMYRLGPVDRAAMFRANVDGTRALIDAATAAAVPRIVHVSSTAALGETRGAEPGEDHRHNGVFRSFYEQTKHIAHGIAQARIRAGAPVILAIPGGVFGPGDRSALAQAVTDFARGKLPVQVDTTSRFNLCHVDAVCDGLVRIVDRSPIGESWILTGANVSMPEVLDAVGRALGRPAPRKLSRALLSAPARILDTIARLTGATPPLSREALAVMDGSTYTYSSAKARARMGWEPGDALAALARYAVELAAGADAAGQSSHVRQADSAAEPNAGQRVGAGSAVASG